MKMMPAAKPKSRPLVLAGCWVERAASLMLAYLCA
jgi:hypothetical protein